MTLANRKFGKNVQSVKITPDGGPAIELVGQFNEVSVDPEVDTVSNDAVQDTEEALVAKVKRWTISGSYAVEGHASNLLAYVGQDCQVEIVTATALLNGTKYSTVAGSGQKGIITSAKHTINDTQKIDFTIKISGGLTVAAAS